MVHSRRATRRRGGGCNVAPKGYTGAWHYEGNVKCKGDPPSDNNNGRNAALAYQVKAYSPNGGRRRATRRATRRRGGGCNGVVSIANASKRSNCQWERTSNGKAKLVPKLQPTRNLANIYSGGRRSTRRS